MICSAAVNPSKAKVTSVNRTDAQLPPIGFPHVREHKKVICEGIVALNLHGCITWLPPPVSEAV